MNDAAPELTRIETIFNSAHLQWGTYIDALGNGYDTAYTLHKSTLDSMNHLSTHDNRLMYFMLSILAAGFTGGLAGGVLAPWVAGAGKATADAVWRTVGVETTKEFLKTSYKMMVTQIAQSDSKPFVPTVDSTIKVYTGMRLELGVCFSNFRDKLKELNDQAEAEKWTRAQGAAWATALAAIPLVKDAPSTKQLPNVAEVARQAELLMWIAWACRRPVTYWRERRDVLRQHTLHETDRSYPHGDYYDVMQEFIRLSPVAERLRQLDPRAYDFATFRFGHTDKTLPDLRRMANLGQHLGGTMFETVAKVAAASDPKDVLVTMPPTPPKH